MAEIVKGFQTVDGIKKYDYGSLANLPVINASYIGLGNVNNTSDANKPVSKAQREAIDQALIEAKNHANELITNINVSGNEIVYIIPSDNNFDNLTSSHTFEEIAKAVIAGKVPVCAFMIEEEAAIIIPLVLLENSIAVFAVTVNIDEAFSLILTINEQEEISFQMIPTGAGISNIQQTTTSNEDGGSNIITIYFTDDTSTQFTVKNGSKGSKGDKGDKGDAGFSPEVELERFDDGVSIIITTKGGSHTAVVHDGVTPERGKDYWTQEDQDIIVNAVLANFTNVSEVGA